MASVSKSASTSEATDAKVAPDAPDTSVPAASEPSTSNEDVTLSQLKMEAEEAKIAIGSVSNQEESVATTVAATTKSSLNENDVPGAQLKREEVSVSAAVPPPATVVAVVKREENEKESIETEPVAATRPVERVEEVETVEKAGKVEYDGHSKQAENVENAHRAENAENAESSDKLTNTAGHSWKCHKCTKFNPMNELRCSAFGCDARRLRRHTTTNVAASANTAKLDERVVCASCNCKVDCVVLIDLPSQPTPWHCQNCTSKVGIDQAKNDDQVVKHDGAIDEKSPATMETAESAESAELGEPAKVTPDRPNVAEKKKKKKTKSKKEEEPLFKGDHSDFCFICDDGGHLICCDYCEKSFHMHCHIPPLLSIPPANTLWKCCECSACLYTKRWKCGACDACLREDCGKCMYCLDKPKFGGKLILKQVCEKKRCPFKRYAKPATVKTEVLLREKEKELAMVKEVNSSSGDDDDGKGGGGGEILQSSSKPERNIKGENDGVAGFSSGNARNSSNGMPMVVEVKVEDMTTNNTVTENNSNARGNAKNKGGAAKPVNLVDVDDKSCGEEVDAFSQITHPFVKHENDGGDEGTPNDLRSCQNELKRLRAENKRQADEIKRLKAAVQALATSLTG